MIYESDADEVARPTGALAQDAEEYERMVRESVSEGQLLTAIEIARDGISRFGRTPVLQQQLALALAQTGALDAARDILKDLMRDATPAEETLGLLGRVHKELWRHARTPAEAAEALRQAAKYYRDAFERHDGFYPGINYAFTLAAAGEREHAADVAGKVAKLARAQLAKSAKPVDGWLLATLAEALTHQGQTTEAGDYYRKAAQSFQGRWRDLASMRRQAREILRFQRDHRAAAPDSWSNLTALRRRARQFFGQAEEGEEWLNRCFDFPSVVVFAGHMVDHPDRLSPRFPAAHEPAVREAMRLYLQQINAGFGYSSAAAGADIIFCEGLLEREAKINLVLPCPVDAFKRQSVSFAGTDWERRFHHVLAHSTSCVVANPLGYAMPGAPVHAASPIGLLYSARMAAGLAALQSQALDLDLHAVALWNGLPGDGPGGTASIVGDWRARKIEPHILTPPAAATTARTLAPATPDLSANGSGAAAPGSNHAPGVQVLKALLFAEVANFHQVGEEQMAAFVTHFKGAMAAAMTGRGSASPIAESWSAQHFFAYERLEDAALDALALRDRVGGTDWTRHGLPRGLGVRIVLHAGPVFEFADPLLQRPTCAGAHVNRAARIWPITPPGEVYATQGFAALCGADRVSSVNFEYLGFLRTTTMFEDAPLYRMDRRD